MVQREEAERDAAVLRAQIAEALADLGRKTEQLTQLSAKLEQFAAAHPEEKMPADQVVVAASSGRSRGRPVRDLLLDALGVLGWPSFSRELTLYLKAAYGRPMTAERFGSLSKDEMETYARGTGRRAVWLCHAITYDRFEPIKRLWARSDWPLERRIVAPTTGQVQYLMLTQAFCTLAHDAEAHAAVPDVLRITAADHARGLPGVKPNYANPTFAEWADQATALLREVLPADQAARAEAAETLARRSELYQLFGAPDVLEGGRPQGAQRRAHML